MMFLLTLFPLEIKVISSDSLSFPPVKERWLITVMHLASSHVSVGLSIYSIDTLLGNGDSKQTLLFPSGLPNMLVCFLPNPPCNEAMISCGVLSTLSQQNQLHFLF